MFVILDVDHTLLQTNVSYLFGRELYRKKFINIFQVSSAAFLYGLHYLRIISQEKLHKILFRLLFKGRDESSFRNLFRLFFASQKKDLVRDNFLKLLQKTYSEIVLVSSSPDFIVQEIGKALNINEVYGTEYCVQEGCFSSLGVILTGQHKTALAKRLNRGPYAVYTDSSDDIPLLESAQVPIAVCPDRVLFRYAQKKGWTIMFPSTM